MVKKSYNNIISKFSNLDKFYIHKNFLIYRINNRIGIHNISNLVNGYFFCFSNIRSYFLYSILRNINKIYFGAIYGFACKFILEGIGYKNKIIRNSQFVWFNLGYSHKLMVFIPNHIYLSSKKRSFACLSRNFRLSERSFQIFKNLRFPDIYKGRGIRVLDKELNLKIGKQR